MKLKEIYLENQNRTYSNVTKIKKENIKLEMDPIKKLKENWIPLVAVLVFIIAILLLNFNPTYFCASIALIFFLIIVFIFGNKSSLICDKNTLNIKQGFQKLNIPYDYIKSVYIGKVNGIFSFLPPYTYNIIIRYEDNFSFLRELEFSLLCADVQDVNEFINNFSTDNKVEPRYVQFQKRKFWRKLFDVLITIILFIAILLYFLSKSGINLGSII